MATHDEHERSAGYEQRDAAFKPIVALTLGLAALVFAVVLGMRMLFDYFEARGAARDAAPHPMATATEPPAPRLQSATSVDLDAQRARERELLGQYAWVDRQAGVVRMPIERALELVAERGLPVRKQ